MMKKIFYVSIALALFGLVVFTGHHWLVKLDDPGFVLMGINGWSIETSVVIFGVALIVCFCLWYIFFRFLGWLLRSPTRISARRKNIKFNRSQDALVAGLVDSAEGNWEKAEKTLIKHASHSGSPLIHYLTAARAAQSRGALAKRDEYLRLAAHQSPGSDIVVGLTEAELNLAEHQFERAVETLTKLHSINPKHASVLKLLHQAYKKVGNWEGLRKLLPSLNEQKILMEAEVKLLETEVYSMQLKQAAASGSVEEIQTLWTNIPAHIRSMSGLAAIYFAAMISVGAGATIEADLVKALSTQWNTTLLALFANVESQNVAQQLSIAERWLPTHPHDALLLTVLGRLYFKQGDLLQAEQYLAKSIAEEPTVQAYQLIGEVLTSLGDMDKAIEYYKLGLELASSQVVSQVDMVFE